MTDLPKLLRIKAGVIEMGERIAWGSDSALMREAADALEMAAPAVQGEPVAYLRKDQLRQVQRMGPMLGEIADSLRVDRVPVYTAPQPAEQQPAPDVAELQAELERERKRRFDGNEQASREHREDMKSLVEALELAIEYWRDRQQRYKNRKPRWVADAESALATHRKQQEQSND